MDGVEEAVLLCASKLACSLLFLPSPAASYSPVSFCCCCLLTFTDFLVTVSLTLLRMCESWLTAPTVPGEVVALRFLLFLSHTYAAVLLLLTLLIAGETLIRHLFAVAPGQTGPDGERRCGEANAEEDGSGSPERGEDKLPFRVLCYLCCLAIWVAVALRVWWRWKLHEEWAVYCLHTTNSLIGCLPTLLSPTSSTVNPWCGVAFLSFLLLFLTTASGLQRQRPASAQTGTRPRWQDLVVAQYATPEPENGGTSGCESAQSVGPKKTAHGTFPWNAVQMLARNRGGFVLIFPECLSAERGEQAQETSKSAKPLTFMTEARAESRHTSRFVWWCRVFPCLWANIMIGCFCLLSTFVLPLNLSVNIFLLRTIETLLEMCARFLVLPVSSGASAFRDETASEKA